MPFELPPPPATQIVESWQWRDWFFRLREAVVRGLEGSAGDGQVPVSPGGGSPPVWMTVYFSQAFTSQTSITVNHNMAARPVVQVFTTTAEMIIPMRVKHLSNDVFVVNFSIPTSGTIIALR